MITIRKADSQKDTALLNRMEKAIFPIDYCVFDQKTWKEYKETYIFFVRNIPIGHLTLQHNVYIKSYISNKDEKKKGALHISSIGVLPHFQKKGLGNLMVAWVIAYAKIGKFISINATSRESNQPMINTFRRFGFQTKTKLKKFYPDGEDAIREEIFF